jgi:hypothetical protein
MSKKIIISGKYFIRKEFFLYKNKICVKTKVVCEFSVSAHPSRLKRNPTFKDIRREKFGSINTSYIDTVVLMKGYFILLTCKIYIEKLASFIFDQMTGFRNSYSRAIEGTLFIVLNTCIENSSFWLIRDLILIYNVIKRALQFYQ